MATLDAIRAEWRRIYGRELVSLLPRLEPCEGQPCGCNLAYLQVLRGTAPLGAG